MSDIAGVSNLAHDCGLSIIDEFGFIKFASQNERYSKIKHDVALTKTLVEKFLDCDTKVFYEDLVTNDGDFLWQGFDFLERDEIAYKFYNGIPEKEKMENFTFWRNLNSRSDLFYQMWDNSLDHHRSHGAQAFYTRPWDTHEGTVILSMDGGGKDSWSSNNIYTYDEENNRLVQKHSDSFSVGQIYTEITEKLGFRAMEEGTTMGLSSFGEPIYYDWLVGCIDRAYSDSGPDIYKIAESILAKRFRQEIKKKFNESDLAAQDFQTKANIAASLQKWAQEQIVFYAKKARKYGSKLCYSGGVAQNIIANSMIRPLFDDMWIATNPGDGGSSLGCAAWEYCNQYGGNKIRWVDAYLGHNIDREVNPREVVDYILKEKVCGIANGRSEWGPRALGNRSLIGDVRYDIKDTVNKIKKREKYRPFGPLILEEEFDKWFSGPTNEYMQFVCKPNHDLASVIHVDGTSRVQTVPANSRSIIRPILEEYFERTGVPMLLNTSLNIKGQPILNDEEDAKKFEEINKVRVF